MFDSRTKMPEGSAQEPVEPRESCSAYVRHSSRAFTLPELLVVVAIIGILAALLSTAFNNTKARGRKISCLNNMRQLSYAWRLYIDDSEDALPLNQTGPSPLPEQFFGRRLSSNSWVSGSPKEDVTPANIIHGSIFPYTGRSLGLFHCPSDRSTVVGRAEVLRNRSYSMSGYLNGDDAALDPRVKMKESDLNNPSPDRIFVFIEEHEDSPWLGAFWVLPKDKLSVASSVNWTSIPSDRHNQGCNLTFADGHVEYCKWFWPKKASDGTHLSAANAQELRDLRRLQESIPKP